MQRRHDTALDRTQEWGVTRRDGMEGTSPAAVWLLHAHCVTSARRVVCRDRAGVRTSRYIFVAVSLWTDGPIVILAGFRVLWDAVGVRGTDLFLHRTACSRRGFGPPWKTKLDGYLGIAASCQTCPFPRTCAAHRACLYTSVGDMHMLR